MNLDDPVDHFGHGMESRSVNRRQSVIKKIDCQLHIPSERFLYVDQKRHEAQGLKTRMSPHHMCRWGHLKSHLFWQLFIESLYTLKNQPQYLLFQLHYHCPI